MAATFNLYAGDGTNRAFAVTFPYLDKSHVRLYVDNTEMGVFVWLNAAVIQLPLAPAPGAIVRVARVTPTGIMPVDFTDGSVLAEAELDLISKYAAYLAEEAFDRTSTALITNSVNEFDARGLKIVNVAEGTNPTDAASWGQLTVTKGQIQVLADAVAAGATQVETTAIQVSQDAATATAAALQAEYLKDSFIAVNGGMGYLEPVPYGAGISITLPAQLVTYMGDTYAPRQVALPFTTSGVFEVANFRLIQGVASAALAGPSGALSVGFGTTTVGAALAVLTAGEVNLLSSHLAGGADNTGTVDATAAIQAALDIGAPVYAPAGHYKINGDLLTTKQTLRIRGDGDATVFDFSGGGVLEVVSTVTSLPFISATVLAGSNQVSFAAAHGLVEGDVFVLHNPTAYSFAPFRDYYRDGCMFRVAATPTATTVITYGLAPSTFAFGAMNTYKINGGSVVFKDVRVIPPPSGIAVWIDAHQSVKIHDVSIANGAADTAIEVYRCYDVDVRGLKAVASLSDAYPIVFSNTQNVTLSASALYSTRHCLAIGGRSGPASVPCRDFLISDTILFNDGSLGIGASDIHGNSANIVYQGCTMNSNANMAGKDVAYKDCTIVGRPVVYFPDGNCVTGSEVIGGVFEILDCKFVTNGNGSANGFINLNVDQITADFTLVVRGLTIVNKNASPSDSKIATLFVGESGSPTHRIDIVMDGVTYKATSGFGAVALAGLKNISSKSSIIIDNFGGPPMSFVVASNSTNYNMPMRLQRQAGGINIGITSGSSLAVGTNVAFRYAYPRVPSASVVCVGDAVGGRMAIPSLYTLTATSIRPQLATGDSSNWLSTSARDVKWCVEISEV